MTAFGKGHATGSVREQTRAPTLEAPIATERSNISAIVAIVSSAVVAALIFYLTYRFWRGTLGIPLELNVVHGGNLHIDGNIPSKVRPWAPWWIPTTISALLSIALWYFMALRRQNFSFWRCFSALLLMQLLSYAICQWSLDIGAIAQFDPTPPVSKMIMVLPAFIVAGFLMAAIQLGFGGWLVIPIVTAFFAFILRLVLKALMRLASAAEQRI